MKKIHISPEELYNIHPLLQGIMDLAFDESCIMDKSGHIIHCSESSPLIWGRPNSESIGMHITELDSASPYPELLETGKPIMGKLHIINGMTCITHMIPLFDDNDEIIGAFGVIIFRGMEKLKRLVRDNSFDDYSQKLYDQLSRAESSFSLSDFIGTGDEIKNIKELCKKVAKTDYPVLIRGETGCGKEILASGIHTESVAKSTRPFVKINCTAIPQTLLESELFGYEKGAFSGALTTKQGKFEIAGNGTILLDEIGDLDLSMQSKLLRVIEQKEFERLGGNTLIPVRARIIASTNSNLEQKMAEGKFREDLYYRLSVVEMVIPPLRNRREDIVPLIDHFLKQADSPCVFSPEALELMIAYNWPGNARQLRNLITKLSIMTPDDVFFFSASSVGEILNTQAPQSIPSALLPSSTQNGGQYNRLRLEKQAIIQALNDNGYSISAAARDLCFSRNTLYNKIKKHDISIQRSMG